MSENTPSRSGKFFGPPSTRPGRLSAWALVVEVAFVVVTSTAFESASPTIGQLNIIPGITFLIVLAALVAGLVALIRDRERSWIVWVSTGLPAIVLGAEIISMLIPGE